MTNQDKSIKTSTVRILGFDPGYGRLGFGVIDSPSFPRRGLGGGDRSGVTKPTAVTFGVITTLSTRKHQDRLLEINNDAESLIKAHKPDLIAIEELFFVKSVTTALKVAEVRGILLYLAAKHGIDVVEVKPVEVKMALTGYGKADKRQMQEMVKAVFGLSKIPKPDDAADALAIAWAANSRTLQLYNSKTSR